MLAYAANRPRIAQRGSSPNALLMVIGAHVAVLAVIMSAKMDLPGRIIDRPPTVFWVPQQKDPPPVEQRHSASNRLQNTHDTTVDHPRQRIQTNQGSHDLDMDGDDIGPKLPPIDLQPIKELPVRHDPIRSGAQLVTPTSELKPPYPASKLINEEEATLTLRLTIDQNGRVIAVDPVGRTDPIFLAAARRHLIAHWRYKPAMTDGQAITSSAVITLRFQLDG